jgi:hypothetical protein
VVAEAVLDRTLGWPVRIRDTMPDDETPINSNAKWPWTGVATVAAAVVAAIGSLIGGLAAAGVIGGGGNTPSAHAAQSLPEKTLTGTAAADRPTVTLEFPASPGEKHLAALIPAYLRPTCERSPNDVGMAGLTCVISGVSRVTYILFETPAAAARHMQTRLSLGDDGHDCGTAASGSGTFRDMNNKFVGNLVCYPVKGTAWLEWSNVDLRVYAYAVRTDADWKKLFKAWEGLGPYSA